jgi:hypothetical protein
MRKLLDIHQESNPINVSFEDIYKANLHRINILLMHCEGTILEGSEGNTAVAYLCAMRELAERIWLPKKCVIDLTELTYTFGNSIEELLYQQDFRPCAVVVSDKNRSGFRALFQDYEGEDIVDNVLFFDDVEVTLGDHASNNSF